MASPEQITSNPQPVPTVPDLLKELDLLRTKRGRIEEIENVMERTQWMNDLSEQIEMLEDEINQSVQSKNL